MVLVSSEKHASLWHALFLSRIHHPLAGERGDTEAGVELGSLPVPTGSHLWKCSFGKLRAPEGWWWHIPEPNEAIWGQISLQEVAPHTTEFLWPHHPVLAGWLLCQQISSARPKGKEADAHVKTAMSQSNNLGPSCQLKLLQFQRGVFLTFSLLLILIPS